MQIMFDPNNAADVAAVQKILGGGAPAAQAPVQTAAPATQVPAQTAQAADPMAMMMGGGAPAAAQSITLDQLKQAMAAKLSAGTMPQTLFQHVAANVTGFAGLPAASPDTYPAILAAINSCPAG